jgi:hypothetical protein
MRMQRRPTDDEARNQASLRDAAMLDAVNPGLERPGYLRSSLRDCQKNHEITRYDWERYLDVADRHLRTPERKP